MIAFALLLAAMAAFLASTIQTRLWLRGLCWIGGVAALTYVTYRVVAFGDHRGFFHVLMDAADNLSTPKQSVLWQSIHANSGSVVASIRPLADVLLVIATLAAVSALAAFSKGERLERLVRPLLYGLIGAMIGGSFALGVMALGLGDIVKTRQYAAFMSKDTIEELVHDGDTFRLGEVSLCLYGIDAPELNQICIPANPNARSEADRQCGRRARAELVNLLRDKFIKCNAAEFSRANVPLDALGRPLVTCFVEMSGGEQDVAQILVERGWAFPYHGKDEYVAAAIAARENKPYGSGFAKACTLDPRSLRRERAYRETFRKRLLLAVADKPDDVNLTLGCKSLAVPNSDNPR